MNLFLLAAGEGTRFRPHTEILPKPALPFCGAPLLYYSFYLAKTVGLSKIVINSFHLPNEIHKVGRTLSQFGVQVEFSDEQPLLLGSAGGMAKARSQLINDDGFLAMNADEVIIPKDLSVMKRFVESAKASKNLATLMVMRHPEAGKKFGAIWVDKSGAVVGFGKEQPTGYGELTPFHFIGPMYFKKEIFERLKVEPSNILHDVLKAALSSGETVGYLEIECHWFETGNLNDYLDATKNVLDLLKQGNPFLKHMWKELNLKLMIEMHDGATILRPTEFKQRPKVEKHHFLVVGHGAVINENTLYSDCVLADGVQSSSALLCAKALIL